MVRNYIKVSTKNLMNTTMLTQENLQFLLDSDLKPSQKELIQEYMDHTLGTNVITDTKLKIDYQKYCAKKLREINKEHIYQFVTLSPDFNKRNIPYTPENIRALKEWCT